MHNRSANDSLSLIVFLFCFFTHSLSHSVTGYRVWENMKKQRTVLALYCFAWGRMIQKSILVMFESYHALVSFRYAIYLSFWFLLLHSLFFPDISFSSSGMHFIFALMFLLSFFELPLPSRITIVLSWHHVQCLCPQYFPFPNLLTLFNFFYPYTMTVFLSSDFKCP